MEVTVAARVTGVYPVAGYQWDTGREWAAADSGAIFGAWMQSE